MQGGGGDRGHQGSKGQRGEPAQADNEQQQHAGMKQRRNVVMLVVVYCGVVAMMLWWCCGGVVMWLGGFCDGVMTRKVDDDDCDADVDNGGSCRTGRRTSTPNSIARAVMASAYANCSLVPAVNGLMIARLLILLLLLLDVLLLLSLLGTTRSFLLFG